MNNMEQLRRKAYASPGLSKWGTVADLTQVGQTNPGGDVLYDQAKGKEGGSIYPAGLPGSN